ncbi:glutathione s-transferase protein [Apiospora saccharicola]
MAEYPPEKAPKPGFNIYGAALPNPAKLTIMAEELGIPYNLITMDLADIRSSWYESINPNGKLPAIVHVKEDGTSETVFESGACLLYLAHEFDKEHRFHDPVGTSGYWKQLSWLSWQISGYGPMMGQAVHFHRYTPEPIPYGAWRYGAECRRLNHVLEKQLAWCESLSQRPGVQRGLQVPSPYMTGDEGVVDPANQDALKMMRGHFSKVFKEASDQW